MSLEKFEFRVLFVCHNERASSPTVLLSLEAACLSTATNAGQVVYAGQICASSMQCGCSRSNTPFAAASANRAGTSPTRTRACCPTRPIVATRRKRSLRSPQYRQSRSALFNSRLRTPATWSVSYPRLEQVRIHTGKPDAIGLGQHGNHLQSLPSIRTSG